jgi:hypothetical protein
MLDLTRDMIRDIAKHDPSITPEMLKAGLAAFAGRGAGWRVDDSPVDQVVKRGEVARLLGVSVRTVSAYGRRGLLVGVRPGAHGARNVGYSLASVRRFMESGRGVDTAADSDGGTAA